MSKDTKLGRERFTDDFIGRIEPADPKSVRPLSELELDHEFWRAISADANFMTWFIGKTRFAGRHLTLVTDVKWHQRWYRDPETKAESETDILLLFDDIDDGCRCALHIENKPAHRTWTKGQAEQYRKRAANRAPVIGYKDFGTVLIAPASFMARWPAEVELFDDNVTYEEIGHFVQAFALQVSGYAPPSDPT